MTVVCVLASKQLNKSACLQTCSCSLKRYQKCILPLNSTIHFASAYIPCATTTV